MSAGRTRLWSYVLGVVIAGATIAPVAGIPAGDSFPFSEYPMFSFRRTSTEARITHVLGVEHGGDTVVLPPSAVGTDEVIQAFETVRREVARGNAAVLCAEVAGRIDPGRFQRVIVSTDLYDAAAYFEGDRESRERTVHAECEPGR